MSLNASPFMLIRVLTMSLSNANNNNNNRSSISSSRMRIFSWCCEIITGLRGQLDAKRRRCDELTRQLSIVQASLRRFVRDDPEFDRSDCYDTDAEDDDCQCTTPEVLSDGVHSVAKRVLMERSKEKFEALYELISESWATLGKPQYAQWLEDDNYTKPWKLWFATASDTPGVVPNQNPIEVHRRTIKATAVTRLRAATVHVFAGTLPKLLVEYAGDIKLEPIRHYVPGPSGFISYATGSTGANQLGVPEKKKKFHNRDPARKSQFTVDTLIKGLVEKPASVINWSVLNAWAYTDKERQDVERNFVGKIKLPFMRGGMRFWEMGYEEHEEISTWVADVLARDINYSVRTGHTIVPN
ncbi:hypothetical protein ON010_g12451 [Phytophthora cinnamomi]|nr:hypothetical protein ON010_g12451 [Phytophthora cinnamomi]